jgi:hypothetical protein
MACMDSTKSLAPTLRFIFLFDFSDVPLFVSPKYVVEDTETSPQDENDDANLNSAVDSMITDSTHHPNSDC